MSELMQESTQNYSSEQMEDALDKLGSKCEMTTVFNPEYHIQDVNYKGEKTNYNGYKWLVNWEDFEGEFKTIENVGAKLTGLQNNNLPNYLANQKFSK